MKKLIVPVFLLPAFLLLAVPDAQAHGILKKALVEHYGFAKSTSVSCYACHSRSSEVPPAQWAAAANKKVFRNEFGTRIEKLLDGQDVTKQINDAKAKAKTAASEAQAEKVKADSNAKISKIFLEAIEKFEATKSPDGPTWKELITSGKVNGIKP